MKAQPLLFTPFAGFASALSPQNGNASMPILSSSLEGISNMVAKLEYPRLVVYAQTFRDHLQNPVSLLPLVEHKTGVTHVIIGSFHLHDEPGKIMLNNDPPDASIYDELWKEVAVLQEKCVKVLGLLGGAAAGTYVRMSGTDEEFQAFYEPLLVLIKTLSLDGLDVDIEEEVDLSVPLRLLRALHRDLGPSFILTMAPLASALSDEAGQNLSGFSYFELDALANLANSAFSNSAIPTANQKLISFCNAQFYGGFARDIGFYKSIVDAGWEPERVVMGVLGSKGGGNGNGFIGLQTLTETIGELRSRYPMFGGVAVWEYWDAGADEEGGNGEINELDRKAKDEIKPWQWVRSIGEALWDGKVDGEVVSGENRIK